MISDVLAKDGKKAPSKGPMAVRINVAPMSVDQAASQLLKAVKAQDTTAIADALRLAYSACQEEYDEAKGKGDDPGGY